MLIYMSSRETIKNLPNNNRFYILLFSLLLSIGTLCWLRTQISSDQLFYIRLQQLFGFISIAYLYGALIVSPVERLVGKRRWMQNLLFARRAIGVSAAYFAVLHATVALWGQIGGVDGLGVLPDRFMWSLTFGAIALLILCLMAATSFNAVIAMMTFRKWKWLHRFIYLGSILIILHVWLVGTHMAYSWVQITTFLPLSLLFGLEAWCIVSKIGDRYPIFKAKDYALTLTFCLWLLSSGLLFMMPALVRNYHSEHHTDPHSHARTHTGDEHE
jgi:methionine sulfoxide reductase heme-binding subunit